jgi:hypothetical protein
VLGGDSVCPDGQVCSPASMTCELHAVDAPDARLPDAGPDSDVPLRYRQKLTITNGATTALPTGYTIRIAMPAMRGLLDQHKVKPDLSDLRVRRGGTEIDRIADLDAGAVPATISFALQAPIAAGATTTDYELHYGGANAAPALAKGTNVFPVYDDFASGIATTWIKNDAPAAVDGKLVLRAGHTDAVTTNAATDNLPAISAIELVATVTDPTSNGTTVGNETFYYWFGYQRAGDFTAAAPWALWISRTKGAMRGEQQSPVGCEAQGQCDGTDAAQNTAPHYYVIERDPKATRFYRDGALSYTATVSNDADYAVMIRSYLVTSDVQIDWIRARARVSPEPTVAASPEEIVP